ncbi:molecular chaperone HtpG [Holophaga foetida]|uniref:molecular chaperone HtpG n=1 Tax=Holophaga foetida TaxID=35839 RepID=UPI0002471C60|nr:molecular chaperone HtpG [Holophaga foetida]
MTQPAVEKLEFKSELRQVLNLITHSLYSHREVFLRELISNACDAIDKIRFNSLQNEQLLEGNRDWKIKLVADKEAGTLTVSDNGVGMDHDAIIENLGTIAKSGTKAFLENLKQADAATRPELIGQFGVGFYSAFMVADQVTVVSRAAGQSGAVKWVSDGQGEYTLEPAERDRRGTDVTLHIKDEEKEFLDPWRLRQIVKQFSDFVEHPVVMDVEKSGEGDAKVIEEEVINSRKALWLRSKGDVTQDEHNAFYQQISGNFDEPLKVIHYSGEGTVEFKALLYIPKTKSFDLQYGDVKAGPKLYVNRVQIMDHCEALLPSYLRFVTGVVDCADLPLNVSRELLQHNPLLEKIQRILVKQVLKALEDLKTSAYDDYLVFHDELGNFLKEGLGRDWNNREALADLLLFHSVKTEAGKRTTLAQYAEAMPEDQKEILYLAGEQRSALANAPCLEVYREKDWDVLLLTEPIDEFVLPGLPDYKGKPLKAADRSVPELKPEEKARLEAATEGFKPLFEALQGRIQEVKEVRLSSRLKGSPACLVPDEGAMGASLERLLRKMGRSTEEPSKRILELNPEHPLVKTLQAFHQQNAGDERVENLGRLLYEEALIAEGSRLEDPSAFIKRINALVGEKF